MRFSMKMGEGRGGGGGVNGWVGGRIVKRGDSVKKGECQVLFIVLSAKLM